MTDPDSWSADPEPMSLASTILVSLICGIVWVICVLVWLVAFPVGVVRGLRKSLRAKGDASRSKSNRDEINLHDGAN